MDHHKLGQRALKVSFKGVLGEALKHHFQHSQAKICGKMALKIGDVFPLTFT